MTMPAMLEDPSAPPIPPPLHHPNSYSLADHPFASASATPIPPRIVTLRDRTTTATLLPVLPPHLPPPTLLTYLTTQFNLEIERGDTYPSTTPLSPHEFGSYWFQSFGAVMLLGEVRGWKDVWAEEQGGVGWEGRCLGTFYIRPNYPGRSSHVCNGGFIVTDAARNRGVGRLMGEGYLEWAPKLNYTYSVFNLVYETNVASIRIWDALGFKRIGRVKGAGNLRCSPHELVDAIIYGRDLGPDSEDCVSEERFDKIRFYLKHGKYPNGADRAEKSRLRSAATHYKLLPAENEDEDGGDSGGGTGKDNERLMLKDKEVVADPQRQYEIARRVHAAHHGGINKTTATIAEKYHWVRIKETVSLVIKNCPDCKDASKVLSVRPGGAAISGEALSTLSSTGVSAAGNSRSNSGHSRRTVANNSHPADPNSMIERLVNFDDLDDPAERRAAAAAATGASAREARRALDRDRSIDRGPAVAASLRALQNYADIPLDPQIMRSQQHQHLSEDGRGGEGGVARDVTGREHGFLAPQSDDALVGSSSQHMGRGFANETEEEEEEEEEEAAGLAEFHSDLQHRQQQPPHHHHQHHQRHHHHQHHHNDEPDFELDIGSVSAHEAAMQEDSPAPFGNAAERGFEDEAEEVGFGAPRDMDLGVGEEAF